MRIIHWHVEMGMQGAEASGTLTVEDNATDEEIESAVSDEVFNVVQWGWSEQGK